VPFLLPLSILSPFYFSWWHWSFCLYCFTIWKHWCYESISTEPYI